MSASQPTSVSYRIGAAVRSIANAVRDLVGIGGCGLVSYGVWEIYRPAGLITAGVLMVAACLLLARAGG